MSRSLRLAAAAILVSGVASAQQAAAVYRVDFDATWSAATHPHAYPLGVGAHFSGLIGGTHDETFELWGPGGIASPGIESMAETGGILGIIGEMNTAIANGNGGEAFFGGAADAPGTAFALFTVTDQHSLVSLVTMIAPSPDWFVGVHGLDLLEDGQWLEEVVVPLRAYDSGTDSGPDFNSVNADVTPHEPISLLTTPFTGNDPLGTFRFTRLASALEYGCGSPFGSVRVQGSGSDILPLMGQTRTLEFTDTPGTMQLPSLVFWSASATPGLGFPCGVPLPGLGLSAPGAPGELLVGAPLILNRFAGVWNGTPVTQPLPIPSDPSLSQVPFYVQGYFIDGTGRVGLTSAMEFVIGL